MYHSVYSTARCAVLFVIRLLCFPHITSLSHSYSLMICPLPAVSLVCTRFLPCLAWTKYCGYELFKNTVGPTVCTKVRRSKYCVSVRTKLNECFKLKGEYLLHLQIRIDADPNLFMDLDIFCKKNYNKKGNLLSYFAQITYCNLC